MFAKTPPPQPAAPPPRASQGALGVLAKPYVGAGSGLMVFGAIAGLLLLTNADPGAGTPTVRLSLAHIGEFSGPVGWKDSLPAEPAGEAQLASQSVSLTDASDAPVEIADAGPMGGAAVITLPGGGRADGAVASVSSLAQAPLSGLFSPGPGGDLPVIAADGRTSFKAYARPFVADGRPRVALVIGGLGLNAKATRQAIDGLPPEVTLSFVPYADGLQGWIDLARAAGHEVLLEAPMEPKDYPADDPGPYTLMADGGPTETVRRLDWLLSRATGYFAVTNYLGSKFTASAPAMSVFAAALRARGLGFVDDGSAARFGGDIPRASADRIIDDQLAAPAIDQQLAALEAQASRAGAALGSGFAYPVTLDEAARWASALASRGYQLAPASAVMAQR
ncbi:MAG TPA: divergent polysaccharide deacetylase family protein [Caulobacteraceae bacterium]